MRTRRTKCRTFLLQWHAVVLQQHEVVWSGALPGPPCTPTSAAADEGACARVVGQMTFSRVRCAVEPCTSCSAGTTQCVEAPPRRRSQRWRRLVPFICAVVVLVQPPYARAATIDSERTNAVLGARHASAGHLRGAVPVDPAERKPGADTLTVPPTTTTPPPTTTPRPNITAIMFSHIPKPAPPKEEEPEGASSAERFAETKSSVHSGAQQGDSAGAASDPWWLNPPPWWLPPPPEWGAAPVSMYSSFYNPGNVQNPRPDRTPSSFAPYPIMT